MKHCLQSNNKLTPIGSSSLCWPDLLSTCSRPETWDWQPMMISVQHLWDDIVTQQWMLLLRCCVVISSQHNRDHGQSQTLIDIICRLEPCDQSIHYYQQIWTQQGLYQDQEQKLTHDVGGGVLTHNFAGKKLNTFNRHCSQVMMLLQHWWIQGVQGVLSLVTTCLICHIVSVPIHTSATTSHHPAHDQQ